MAIRFYDEALVEKITKWIRDPNLRVLKPNEVTRLFQLQEDDKLDTPLTLPLISISRDPRVGLSISTKRNLTFDGLILDQSMEKSIQLNAIPIEINYQIDIYTRRYDEGDEYLRNFVFNLINYPEMRVYLPYNQANIEHICHIRLDPEAMDNSDVSEKLFADEFTRWTLTLSIDDAYLFGIPVNDNSLLYAYEVYTKDTETNELEYQGNGVLEK